MNIVYLSEQNLIGKVSPDAISFRSDYAWMKMLDAFHLPYSKAMPSPENEYYSVIDSADLILFVPSKLTPDVMILVDQIHKTGKKVCLVQEGPKTYWQNWPMKHQLLFISLLKKSSIVFCHNENDKKYFENLTNSPVHTLKTVMDVLYWKEHRVCPREKNESVFLGGNMVEWYGGSHSYIVGSHSKIERIGIPTMGRTQPDEKEILPWFDKRVEYFEYMSWQDFMMTLKDFKYAVHLMPISAAGSFSLNCGALGIPCIGNKDNDTQRLIFPDLSISADDLKSANELMNKLMTDQDFYDMVVAKALQNVKDFDIGQNKESYEKLLSGVIDGL